MSKWFIRKTNPGNRLRLFCFSYAGGNAQTYRSWDRDIGAEIEVCAVQLPGRGARMVEPLYADMGILLKDLAPQIVHEAKLPFAFFGHSLGGLIAFEMTRYLHLMQLPMPVHLIVSGCNAPQRRNVVKPLHKMSDRDLIYELERYNGTPPEILAHKELMDLVLPMIRADFSLAENYAYRSGPKLSIPISVLAGRKDDRSSEEQVDAWQLETSCQVQRHWFEGDHFFINSEREAVKHVVSDILRPLTNGR